MFLRSGQKLDPVVLSLIKTATRITNKKSQGFSGFVQFDKPFMTAATGQNCMFHCFRRPNTFSRIKCIVRVCNLKMRGHFHDNPFAELCAKNDFFYNYKLQQ